MKEIIAADAPKNRDGSWTAPEGSPFRSLTQLEVADLEHTANNTTPSFEGSHNATWEQTHPIARAVYEARGLKPKDAK